MNRCIVAVVASFILCSCAVGPVYVAKNEAEGIKKAYENKNTQDIFNKNSDLFKDIYNRYNTAAVGVYNEGIGVTTIRDQNGEALNYLMVNVRPEGLKFDMNTVKPEQRFSYALQQIPLYIRHIKSSDMDRTNIEGLAFGIYWGVKDYHQCDTYGGFVEYINIYLKKVDAQDILEGRRTFADAVKDAEVVTSLDLKPAKAVRPVFQR
jgi:hypothetical protein